MIRAVCFDMDGVLFDTETLGGQVMLEAAGIQGLQLTKEQWHSVIGRNMPSTQAAMRGWFGDRVDTQRFIDDWCRLMLAHVEEHGMPEKPGARDALEWLRASGMKTALVTSNARSVVEVYLRLSGFGKYFDAIVTGEMAAQGKPAPDIFLKAAEVLGVPPACCMGVEDSVNGVKAIHAAGMRCVMVPDIVPYSPALAAYVDITLTSLRELEGAMQTKEKE